MPIAGLGIVQRMGSVVRHRLHANTVILMYHRIANPSCDPWDIAVHPDHFAEHLEILNRRCHVISLAALREDIAARRIQRSVVLTFDDGYLDTLECAQPLLEQHGLPATVFATTRGLEQGGETMWWDPLGAALLHGNPLPDRLEIGEGQTHRTWQVPPATEEPLERWRAEPHGWRQRKPPPPRARLFLDVYFDLAGRSDSDRAARIHELSEWARAAGVPSRSDPHQRTMTADELRLLAGLPGMTVGSHTESHPLLSRVDAAQRWREIAGSKHTLEQVIGHPVVDFSFPNGDVPPDGPATLARAGYQTGCTSRGGAVFPGCNVFTLPRLLVRDWAGARFARWLWKWGHG